MTLMKHVLALPRRGLAYIRSLFGRAALEREMQEEMTEHLARATERLMTRGFSAEEARVEARREFGNVGVLQEEARDARGGLWLDSVRADLGFALRQIARRPLASATIISVLALGIGVHAGLFALLQALTLRPAPGVRIDDALVRLRGKEQRPERGRWYPRGFSYPEYMDIAARRDLFAATTAWTTEPVTIDFGDPQSASTAETHFVTDDYFAVAGVHIPVGTALPLAARADGSDGEMSAIVGDALWRDLLGGARDAIGRTIRVNESLVRIIGVAPPRFAGLEPSASRRTLWMPLASRATVMHGTRQSLLARDSTLLSAAALLADGTSVQRASATVRLISDRAVAQMPPAADGRVRATDVVPLRARTALPETNDVLFGSIVFGTIGVLVLLMVCTNVSALVLGAGVARSQEIAIRLSLGASRRRLVRQLVTESCMLALLGGVAGLAVFAAATRFIARIVPDLDVSPDLRTAVFTAVIAVSAGIICGLSPALHATRRGVADVLKGGTGGSGAARRRLQSSFVGAQIAVTQPLLLAIAVLIALVMHQDDRPMSENVTTRIVRMRFDLRRATASDRTHLRAAFDGLAKSAGVDRVVAEAAGLDHLDFAPIGALQTDSSNAASIAVNIEGTDPGYFGILDVPIVRGRDVLPADTARRDLPVVIGSDVAHELWGNADPLGRRFRQVQHGAALERVAVVVGVYDGTKGTTRGNGRRVFTMARGDWRGSSYLVRTSGPAGAAIPALRDRLRAAVPQIPPAEIETLKDVITGERREVLRLGAAAAAGGAIVLLLASIGLYGVIGLAVAQRRREIGIRIALGARPKTVVGLLFRQGVRLAGIGMLVGLPFSIVGLVMLAQLVNGDGGGFASAGVSPTAIGVAISLVVLVVASVATWLPARHAATVDPMMVLRAD
jgi:predicted permease